MSSWEDRWAELTAHGAGTLSESDIAVLSHANDRINRLCKERNGALAVLQAEQKTRQECLGVALQRREDLTRCEGERDDATVRLKSLLAELWDGVRIHNLKAPARGRDGERLIHAYCGGIVERDNEIERICHERDEYKALVRRGGLTSVHGAWDRDPSQLRRERDDALVMLRELVESNVPGEGKRFGRALKRASDALALGVLGFGKEGE